MSEKEKAHKGKVEKWPLYQKIEKHYNGLKAGCTLTGIIAFFLLAYLAWFHPGPLHPLALFFLGLFLYEFGLTLGLYLALKTIEKEECI